MVPGICGKQFNQGMKGWHQLGEQVERPDVYFCFICLLMAAFCAASGTVFPHFEVLDGTKFDFVLF
jgi:hypothetical protein